LFHRTYYLGTAVAKFAGQLFILVPLQGVRLRRAARPNLSAAVVATATHWLILKQALDAYADQPATRIEAE
jgi:nitrate/nitrite transporter NarK